MECLVCNPTLFTLPACTKKRPLTDSAQKLSEFPLSQIVLIALAINDESLNVPKKFVLQATREMTNRASGILK